MEINNNHYGVKMVQPVLTRWEYVGMASALFVKRCDGFKKFAEEIRRRESKTNSKKYKVSTDLLELMHIPECITLIHFLNGFHVQFLRSTLQF